MSYGLKSRKSIRTRHYNSGQVPTGAWVVVVFAIITCMSIF